MKKTLALIAVAAVSMLTLAGCVNNSTVPEPHKTLTVKSALSLTVLDESVRTVNQAHYAPDANFPKDSPAYAETSDQGGIFFLAGYSSEKCLFTAGDFSVKNGVGKLELKEPANTADCGPAQLVKPYFLTLPEKIKFSDLKTLNVCLDGKCSPATKLKTPKVESVTTEKTSETSSSPTPSPSN